MNSNNQPIKHTPTSQSCPCEGKQSPQQRPEPCTCEPGIADTSGRSGMSPPSQGSRHVDPAKHGHAAPAGQRDNTAVWKLGPCSLGNTPTKSDLQERWFRKLDRLIGDDNTADALFNMTVASPLTYKGETQTRFLRYRSASYYQVGNTILNKPETIADFYRVTPAASAEAIDHFGTAD